MPEFIAVAVSFVGVLLFYRWVSRPHKVLIGKLLLAGVLLVLTIGALRLMSERAATQREQRKLQSVTIRAIKSLPPLGTADDSRREVDFEVCNHGDETVESVSFYPVAFSSGFSTAHDLRLLDQFGLPSSNRFESDAILKPGECKTLSWYGRFQPRDSVSVVVDHVATRAPTK